MKDLMIAYILQPVEEGARFTDWPLHLTLLPWFRAPDQNQVIEAMGMVAQDFEAIELLPGGKDEFGMRKLPVTLVRQNARLYQLHNRLLHTVTKRGWSLQGRYTGNAYSPHITQKAGQDFDSPTTLDKLYLVEAQSMGYRQVIKEVGLADG